MEKKCQRCGSSRIVDASGKTNDLFGMVYNNKEYVGCVPSNIGLGNDEDCIDLTYCLDCGQMQGNFPIPEEVVNQSIKEQEEGD